MHAPVCPPHPAWWRLLAALLLALAAVEPRARAANIAPDYPLVEKPIDQEIAVAPLIVEATVLAPGSFQAVVEIDTVYKNTAPAPADLPRCLRVTGFNSIAGDRSSRAMRAGDRQILFLQPAGDLYFTPRVGGGRFLLEAATEYGEAKVVVSLGDPLLLVPLDPDHFRTLLRAIVAKQVLEADDDLPPEADRAAAAKTRRADGQAQIDAGVTLAKTSLASGNPARQYFGVVLARSLSALELAADLTALSESNNARLQAESLDALAALIRRYGFDQPRFDRATLLRSARAGLRSTALRTRLAAAQALAEMPADGVAKDLMMFYRDAAAEFLALKSGDDKRAQFIDQRSRFWLSPALLKDPAGEAILLDFAASNDLNTATGALAVLGLRGSPASLPGLVELLGEKDFKYTDDAKVALFRIALSDEVLNASGDWQHWAAQMEKRTPAERLQAGLQRVGQLLKTPGADPAAADNFQRALLLASCLPGELSIPQMVSQTAVPPGNLAPVVFARTQSPLAYPYLARALLTGDDNTKIQAEMALRGWAELEPLVQFGCDSEIGLLAADPTRYGDNPGLDAAAELRGPDVAWGVTAGIATDNTTRYRGRRMQILQDFHGQSFGWGEYELEWNTILWQWATLHWQSDHRRQRPLPPRTRSWLAGERERQASDRTAENIKKWVDGLSDADPLAARANWRRLLIAGLTLEPSPEGQTARSQRLQVIDLLYAATAADRPMQTRLLAINLLGQLRAAWKSGLERLVDAREPAVLRHQAWFALGRLVWPADVPGAEAGAGEWLIKTAGDRALQGTDALESALALWAIRSVPGASSLYSSILADLQAPADLRRLAAAGTLYGLATEPATAHLATLTRLAAGPAPKDTTVIQRLCAGLSVLQVNPAADLRDPRIACLSRLLNDAPADTIDPPADRLRFELTPQPYMEAESFRLSSAAATRISDGLKIAFTAAADDPDITTGDNAARAYAWAYATGAWPGPQFNPIQLEALNPLGRWPQRRLRTLGYALEGLARADAVVPVARLRPLLQSDDDRVAGYAGLILARQHSATDLIDIFNRFNNAVPKTATWFNTIGATGSSDGFKFLTDTMKTTGHEAWLSTWALGFFDSADARAKLIQTATDVRQSNAAAAVFGWTRQLQSQPDLARQLAKGAAADPLLLCEAVEWLPPAVAQDPALVKIIAGLLESTDPAVRLRADLTLTRLLNKPGCRAKDGGRPSAAELAAYWRPWLAGAEGK